MTSLPIDLPEGFVTLVIVGDPVYSGQTIAQKSAPKDEVVNIFQELGVSRRHAKKTLKKKPGDTISPGDVIAVKKNLFGKIKASLVSEISGTILRYERDTGNLVVRADQESDSLTIISPVAGTISLCNNREIVIQTEDALVSEGVSLGTTGEGLLFVLKESFDDNGPSSALFYLDSRATGKIIVAHTITRDLVVKGNSLGVAGFVGTVISDEDAEYLLTKDISLPVLAVGQKHIEQLRPWENKKVLVDSKNKAIILRKEL